ncbi:sensor histidine kinase [Pontibacter locisalis]|uniref:histidine kinase n=1 Tax=Pontibacter locisalis TaxID=1719035 RepID=A0ABW5IMB6_9BACT
MRLLTKTSLYYLLVSFIVFLVGGISFYKIMQTEIYDEVDDQLFTDKENILAYIREHDRLPSVTSGISEAILVREAVAVTPSMEELADTLIFSKYDEEYVPFRYLRFTAYQNDKPYEYTILKSLIDFRDLFESTMLAMAWIFLLLLIGLGAVNYLINKSIWRHFYQTLQKVKRYSLSRHAPLQLNKSSTREFQELNEVLLAMTKKIQDDYVNLKEFTENASHEIQTPLAIVNSKLELFMQSKSLTQQQAKMLEEMYAATTRLSRLNKSLILLTRIENHEFKEHEEVPLHEVVKEQLEQLEEMMAMQGLEVTQSDLEPTFLYMSRGLAEILVSNLLVNAIRHNQEGGRINVSLQKSTFCVRNTGEAFQAPVDKLFGRFMSGNNTSGSLGIGLALVKKISDVYNMSYSYLYEHGEHCLCIKLSDNHS